MREVSFITAEIISKSPLYIGDDDRDILIDKEEGKAYLPATSIVGSFRAYLKSIGEDYIKLFGEQNIESSIYVKDAFAEITKFERRNRVAIDDVAGSQEDKHKIDEKYLCKGLKFSLTFEIHSKEKHESLDEMIYKCLRALNKGIIRFGSNKSNGLGIFEVISVKNLVFDLGEIDNLTKYLKNDFSGMKEIKDNIFNTVEDKAYITFIINGEFTTPLLIGAPKTFKTGDADRRNIKSGSEYIVPGSSFKGVLRSRVEKIAKHFDSLDKAKEMFGDTQDEEEKHMLSRVFVNESIIDNRNFEDKVHYIRIKIDRFAGGTRSTALTNDIPVKGETQFKVLYRKKNDDVFDNYAIGLITLALRDMGTENLPLGGGSNIGRGRFKARTMEIMIGDKVINIDFDKKSISDEKKLNYYVAAAKNFMRQEGKDE
ncbi:RAMP superfamily CRISPR-associated protein [Thermoanaerobacterium sp. RBIITD]|uniref:RAMP superfamily CRISPR-associated protein n=1 Tax=Thermoanaerobacterium sp. RBIITD TaxID=1550240 RepID=UPI000BB95191|nr:RAMP superfamily CRISPR-associated protein [Thermoanaerobacterium sp. RBIITD]SNX52844.1 CRISPR/Cas system CSM-associated protein Csm3, group 7 of RAMP superfamily [Thermoanaerobacterium sp. RBIITD]